MCNSTPGSVGGSRDRVQAPALFFFSTKTRQRLDLKMTASVLKRVTVEFRPPTLGNIRITSEDFLGQTRVGALRHEDDVRGFVEHVFCRVKVLRPVGAWKRLDGWNAHGGEAVDRCVARGGPLSTALSPLGCASSAFWTSAAMSSSIFCESMALVLQETNINN